MILQSERYMSNGWETEWVVTDTYTHSSCGLSEERFEKSRNGKQIPEIGPPGVPPSKDSNTQRSGVWSR
jgi:hypothetical protein